MTTIKNSVGSPMHLGYVGFNPKLQKKRGIIRLSLHNQKRNSNNKHIKYFLHI